MMPGSTPSSATVQHHRRPLGRGSSAALVALLCAACASSGTEEHAKEAQTLLCPELGSNVDVLELPYSDDPLANGRLKAFVATARGLADVVLEMESRTIGACQRITSDIGVVVKENPQSIEEACSPVRAEVERLATIGVEIRVSLVTPRCGPDARREARCSSMCATSPKECAVLCSAQAALYAQCTLPAVSVVASSEIADVMKLVRSLENNLPALLYAEIALGKRLVSHAEQAVVISTRLPGDLKDAGPRGVACAALAATTTGRAVARLKAVVDQSAAVIARLDPEEHPSQRGMP
jgi:hypothetical protein